MKKYFAIAIIMVGMLVLAGCGSDAEETAIRDDGKGGIVVKSAQEAPEQAPATKSLTVTEGEAEQEVNSVLYKSSLGYSTYIIEKFQVEQGDTRDQIISETYPQNKMVVTLMPEGAELDQLKQQVQDQLAKEYSQVSAIKEVSAPIQGWQVDAVDGTRGYTRVFLLQRKGWVYKIELFFDDYGQSTMIPRFYAMLQEMRF